MQNIYINCSEQCLKILKNLDLLKIENNSSIHEYLHDVDFILKGQFFEETTTLQQEKELQNNNKWIFTLFSLCNGSCKQV